MTEMFHQYIRSFVADVTGFFCLRNEEIVSVKVSL